MDNINLAADPTVPVFVTISASPETILTGNASTLSWSSANATSVTIQGIGSVDLNGSLTVSPTETTTYVIEAEGDQGTQSASVTVTVENIMISIVSPGDGDTIQRPDVMVQGFLSNPLGLEVGVTVNGFAALVYDDEFVANHVQLQEGENTLTVTATDEEGNVFSESVDVTVEATDYYARISAIPESGVSPFETKLVVDGMFSIEESAISASGPGAVEYLESSPEEYVISMTETGLYYFTVEVENDSVVYSDNVAVMVVDKAQLDAKLQAVFSRLKTALAAGDVEAAANTFTTRSRERYWNAFEDISGNLSQAAADMGDIELIYVHEDMAKYRIYRTDEIDSETVDVTYYLYFVVDTDGIWRLDQF